MKNKHLVLLFLAVLALGLLARWSPFEYRSVFERKLIRIDTVLLSRLVISIPKQAEMTLEKTDAQWVASQAGRTSPVSADEIQAMFKMLTGNSSYRKIHSLQPDTLGFSPENTIALQLIHRSGPAEKLDIGAEFETPNGPSCYLRLPNHNGIYEVPERFRTVFSRNLDDFRTKTIVHFDPLNVKKIGIRSKNRLPTYWYRNDSLTVWTNASLTDSISADVVSAWLQLFEFIKIGDFADNFDETREREALRTTITLGFDSGQSLSLRFFYQKPPHLPEDLSRLRAQKIRSLPGYVVHSSQNPLNYFALRDSILARNLCTGLLPVEETENPNK